MPQGGQEEMLRSGHCQLRYSSFASAARPHRHPANVLSGGAGLAPGWHGLQLPFGDSRDAVAAVHATLTHCQLGC